MFATHEPETAVSESEWAVCLSGGRVLHCGPTMQLYHQPPSEEAGLFLGPVNWFTQQDAARWLQAEYASPAAFRAEAVDLIGDDDTDLRIRSFRFHGSFAETVVEHIPTSSQRTIVHRPTGTTCQVGQNVRIAVTSHAEGECR